MENRTTFLDKLLKKLEDRGYTLNPGFHLQDVKYLEDASKYVDDPSMISEGCSLNILSMRMKLTFDHVRLLLIAAMDEGEYMKEADFYNRYSGYSDKCLNLLARLGYMDYKAERRGDMMFRISTTGIMCLLMQQAIKDLDPSAFTHVDKTEEPHSNGILRHRKEPVWESEKSSADILSRVAEDFSSLLHRKMEDFHYGRIEPEEFLRTMNNCLINGKNRDFLGVLMNLGYSDMPTFRKVFFLMLCDQFLSHGAKPLDLSMDKTNRDFDNLKDAAAGLVTKGIAVIPPDEVCNNKDEVSRLRYMLSADAAGQLFHGRTELIDYDTLCRQAEVRRWDSIARKELFFDSEMEARVADLRKLMDPQITARLMNGLSRTGRKNLTCLFYGAPGVGKTELCLQIARETGRDCIVADPAKLAGAFVGDSEKNIRQLFSAYKYLAKISDRVPILVFNEAEGLLSKRLSSVRNSAEKSDNAVIGIILQELESFEGIFVAMTNLQTTLDVAMDRRFLFKMRFDYPSPATLGRIITQKIPWLNPEQALSLAVEFPLSGGQIDNVADKCLLEELLSENGPSMEKVRAFCCEELSLRKFAVQKPRRIGFITYDEDPQEEVVTNEFEKPKYNLKNEKKNG